MVGVEGVECEFTTRVVSFVSCSGAGCAAVVVDWGRRDVMEGGSVLGDIATRHVEPPGEFYCVLDI